MKPKNNIEVTQDYEIIPLEKGKAYTILVREWEVIKNKVTLIGDRPNLYHSAGLILFGASISTFIQCLVGNFPKTPQGTLSTPHIICWAAFTVSIIIGVLCFFLGREKKKVQTAKTGDVIEAMELIEERFRKEEEKTDLGLTSLLIKETTEHNWKRAFLGFLHSRNRALASILEECKINFTGDSIDIYPGVLEPIVEDYFSEPDHYERLIVYSREFFSNDKINVRIIFEKK